MIGGARVVQQAVDDLRALVGRGIGGEGLDFGEAGRHADGVEGDATEEGEVFGQRIKRGGKCAVVGPRGAFLDPLLDGCDFGRVEAMADRRHGFVGILGLNAGEQRALRGVARDDGGAVGRAAFERAGAGVEVELALGLPALVTFEAVGFEDGKDLRVEIHAAGLHGFHLALVGDDFLADEMVDGVIGGETGGERRDGRLRRLSEPLLSGLAAFLPVVALAGAGGGTSGCIDFGETGFLLRGIGGPAGVVIARSVGGRRQELPISASRERDRGDGFAELGTAAHDGRAFDADDEPDDGFEDDAVFAALGFKFDPSIAVARRGEAEVAAEVEVVVLRLDRLVVGAGRREGRLELELAVDEERRGSASAQE